MIFLESKFPPTLKQIMLITTYHLHVFKSSGSLCTFCEKMKTFQLYWRWKDSILKRALVLRNSLFKMASNLHACHGIWGRICQMFDKIWGRETWHFVWMDQENSKIVKIRIHHLKGNMRNIYPFVFKKPKYKWIRTLHGNFVLIPADKASNNIVSVCKNKYYYECLWTGLPQREIHLYSSKFYKGWYFSKLPFCFKYFHY
jgi:hypothetical protein